MLAEIVWDHGKESVASVGELDASLDRIAMSTPVDQPTGVEVVRANGDCLLIVLGMSMTLLNFVAASSEPPYFTSVRSREAEGLFTFFVSGGYPTEVPRIYLIGIGEGRSALREFVTMESGLPTTIVWEMD